MPSGDSSWDRARALHARAVVASNTGRPRVAVRLLDRGLDLSRSLSGPGAAGLTARLMITRAMCESELNGPAAAQPFLDQADCLTRSTGDRAAQAIVRAQRGTILFRAGRFADAITELSAAAEIPQLRWQDRPNLLLTLGTAHMVLGETSRAAASFASALEAARASGASLEQYKALHNLGYLEFLRGNLPEALDRMAAAAALGEDLPRGIPLLDRARVLVEAGLLSEADDTLEEAARIFARERLAQDLGEVELSRAECALVRGEPETARRFAVRARTRFRRRDNLRWLRQAELLILEADFLARRRTPRMLAVATALADQFEADGHPAAARMAALVAAELRLASGDVAAARTVASTTRPRPADPIALRLHARYVQARAALQDGDRAAARRAVRAGLTDLDAHRARFGSVELRAASSVHGQRLAQLDVAMAVASGRANEVIAAAERGRAVAGRLPAVRPPRDDETAVLLAELRQVVDRLGAVDLDAGAVGRLHERRRELERRIAARAWTRTGAGDTRRPVGLAELRAAAAERDAVVVYFVASRGVVHAVRTGAASTRMQPIGEVRRLRELARRARADLDALAHRTLPGALRETAAASLHRTLKALDGELLAPLRLPDRRLVVLPPGAMAVLPWTLVPSLRGIPVEVAPSASTWQGVLDVRPLRAGRPRVGAVSGPGLERADSEVTEVADRWPGARLVCGDSATCPDVTDVLTSSDVVHIAAHGRHATDNPLFSSLRLSDGPMFAHELEHTGPLAEHVVLSACELGVATIRPGDEPLGLTSVLLHRGTRSVVAGVAAVGDDVACDVMVRYHDRLTNGRDSAEALADALQDAPDGTPAPFVCFGTSWRAASIVTPFGTIRPLPTKVLTAPTLSGSDGDPGHPADPQQKRSARAPSPRRPVHRGARRRGPRHRGVDRRRPGVRRGRPRARSGRSRRAEPLRPRPQGLPRHRPEHDEQDLVHGRERRAVRRVRPDRRHHQHRDAAVPGDRRLELHRPAEPRHHVHRRRRPDRDGLHRDLDGQERRLPPDHHLPHRPGPRQRRHAHDVHRAHRRGEEVQAVRADGRDRRRQRWRRDLDPRRGWRQRRRRLRRGRPQHRLTRPGLLRHGHRHQRREPRLRGAELPRPARHPGLRRGEQRVRRDAERRAHRAVHRRTRSARSTTPRRSATSSRPPPSTSSQGRPAR